jgi:selenophosphate synthase
MTIQSGGDVGIGTTNPAQKLTIGGIGTNNTDGLKIEDPSNTAYGAHYSYNDASSTVEIGGVTNNVLNDCISIARDATRTITINTSENVGIGTASPNAKLQVAGGVQMADDTDTASAAKAGTLRYRTSGNNSYVDMCMQTGASTYAWVNIVTNNW